MSADDIVDIAVIGGGINGAGIAAEAARRGHTVVLFEAGDLAGATSSASSKLIHGGLRYLEQYAFRLVREALAERETLLAKAPHIVWPVRFVLPHVNGMRPVWMLRAGLFLYDHLARRRSIPPSRAMNLARSAAGRPLRPEFSLGFSYWDCWVDDARLVVANALAAKDAGATVRTRTLVTELAATDDGWVVSFQRGGADGQVRARSIVNAGGPWAGDIAALALRGRNTPRLKLRLVKGSHIVVPRIAGADDAYIFQNSDGRVVFALPFEGAFTLIGTTDEPYDGDPRQVIATDAEESYLLDLANRFFNVPLAPSDVVWRFAGVRPLEDDGSANPSAVSRDYRLERADVSGKPMINVIGGKITTYRRLAENAVDLLALVPVGGRTAAPPDAPLPGGDVGPDGFEPWFAGFARAHPDFDPARLLRLARRYGTRAAAVIDGASSDRDLGPDIGGGLTAKEVGYLKREEWAESADDVLWRRTKAGLHVPRARRDAVADAVQKLLDGA